MRKRSALKLLSFELLAGLLLMSCSQHTTPAGSVEGKKKGTVGVSSPSCIIYRTRKDYSMYVPVTLLPDKSKIESYPDIRDIYYNGKFSVPTLLADGFLLDNRGIGLQVAFLSYTYEEYSKLPSTPPATDMMSLLLDKDPLVDMYQCGKRNQYSDIKQELNVLIKSGKLGSCKKLK